MANVRRIDLGTHGRAAPATLPRPILEQCLRRVMLHYPQNPFRHVPAMSRLSLDGTDTPPVSARHHVWCRVCACSCAEAEGIAVSVKMGVGLAGCALAVRVRSSM